MSNTITGDKNIDREILFRSDDKSIIQACSLNTYMRDTVCDEQFFENLIKTRYPIFLSYKLAGENYKHLYLRNIKYLSLLKEKYDIPYIFSKYSPEEIYNFDPKLYISIYDLASVAAVNAGQLDVLKYLLENKEVKEDLALQLEAVYQDNVGILKYLLDRIGNKFIDSLIISAANLGKYKTFKFLWENYNHDRLDTNYILQIAKREKNIEIVKYLQSK